MNIYP